MNTTRELVQIQPTNLGTGVFSFKEGVPQIQFDIPMMPKIMNGKSLRISGTFSTFAEPGNLDANRPANRAGTAGRDVYIDSRTGVSSAIDFISIANQEGATYEVIKNYNRLCSSIMPLNDSLEDYIAGGQSMEYGACGKNTQQGRLCDADFDFSIPLLCGFLRGNPIDLQLVKGLRLTIQLAADNYVCRNNYWNKRAEFPHTGTSTGGDLGAHYQMKNVMLSFDAEVPDAEGQQAMVQNTNGNWDYEAYSSFYNVVQSSDHNAILNISKSRVISTIMNSIPSSFLNNHRYNSQLAVQFLQSNGVAPPNNVLSTAVKMKDITFTRGGLRQPLDFPISQEKTQAEGVADSQKNFVELNAIRNVWSLSNEVKGLRTELSLRRANNTLGNSKFNTSMNGNDGVQQYNMGVCFDAITDNGVSFKGEPLGIRIQSELTSGVPHSLFVFTKHKNTIIFNNGQVSVIN